jgi:chitin disaccharide deacetylase
MIEHLADPSTGISTSRPDHDIRLIVNADDFGISEPINNGIVEAHRTGIVTATSLMAVGRAFDQAIAWCRAVPTLDVGVHLTLVAEKPLLHKRTSLSGDDGYFPANIGLLLKRLLEGRIRLADIKAEWAAQIQRILDRGIRITHLDSHQHVHALPGVARLTLDLAHHYRIPFVRIAYEDILPDRPLNLHALSRVMGAVILRASCMTSGLMGGRARKFRSSRFLGFQEGGNLNLARLKRRLRSLRPGGVYELMCHPGFTPGEPDVAAWNYRHEMELSALSSPAIQSEIARHGIQLCSFADLVEPLPKQ